MDGGGEPRVREGSRVRRFRVSAAMYKPIANSKPHSSATPAWPIAREWPHERQPHNLIQQASPPPTSSRAEPSRAAHSAGVGTPWHQLRLPPLQQTSPSTPTNGEHLSAIHAALTTKLQEEREEAAEEDAWPGDGVMAEAPCGQRAQIPIGLRVCPPSSSPPPSPPCYPASPCKSKPSSPSALLGQIFDDDDLWV
jgi:hypothetical protein